MRSKPRVMTILGLGAFVVTVAIAQLPVLAEAGPSLSTQRATALCSREALTRVKSEATMPRPGRLVTSLHLLHSVGGGTATLDPPGRPRIRLQDPKLIWAAYTRSQTTYPTAHYQLFLADYSDSIPARLYSDGVSIPDFHDVLAWILLGQDEPFDAATINGGGPFPHQPPPRPTCTFVGRSIDAWNAETGAQFVSAGFVPTHPTPMTATVAPWRP
jgi:hypothetical protein